MRRRPLPNAAETAEIIGRFRTRPARPPPPPAGRDVSRLLKPLEDKFGKGPQALAARWREIVGDTLARRTEPVKLAKPRGGGPASLEIRVDGPSAALIQHQAAEIIDRVNLFLGPGQVSRLRIVQGPVRSTPVRTAPRRPPPLDALEEARLQKSLEAAPDGALKASLLKLGRAVLRAEAAERLKRP